MIKPYSPPERIEIRLDGPEGNAFVLLGFARKYGEQLGWTDVQIDSIINDMQSSDYEHLIQTFDKWYGEYVDLIRPPESPRSRQR